jgi:tripartite-type tricarboxylate transporter receptor subunit TctC
VKRKALWSIYFCLICAVAAYAGGAGESGNGQNKFPAKPIQLICPVRAGGDTDRNTRVIARHLTEILGVNCVVTNIDGAATVLGMQHVLSAPADGYTIIINNCDAFVPLLLGTTKIDQYKDFKTVGIPFEDNNTALLVNAKSGFKDLRDLVEKSKATPNSIEYGGKIGGITQINGIAMEVQWGTRFKFVDVGNAATKLTALLGQKTDVITLSYSLAVDYYKTGELIPLCQLSNVKNEGLNIPLPSDFGLKGLEQPKFFWLGVHPDTDDAIVNILADALEKVTQDPKFRQYLQDNWLSPRFYRGAEAQKVIAEYYNSSIVPFMDVFLKAQ